MVKANLLEFMIPAYEDPKKVRWDGLRIFPWREFGILLEELLPFAA